MQEVYTMILNTSVTTVIAVIFLWQYVNNAKKANEEEKKDKEECRKVSEALEKITQSEAENSKKIINKLDTIISLLKTKNTKRIDKNKM